MGKRRAMGIAFTYVGAVVGAGFSSGQEIWRFFARHQTKGILAVFCVGLFFCILAPFLFRLSKILGINSYHNFFYRYFPCPLPVFFDIVYSTFLVGSTAVMLAGAGTVFKELLGLPHFTGVLVTLVFVLATLYMNSDGILAVNSFLIPILIGITILTVSIYLFNIRTIVCFQEITFNSTQGWLKDAILYGSYNLAMAIATLSGIFSREEEGNLFWGGFWGGIILFILNLLIYLGLMAAFHSTPREEIPLLFIARSIGQGIYLAYIIALYFAMVSTAIANYYAFNKRLITLVPVNYETGLLISVVFLLPFMGSGFSTLVGKLYPLFGYLGIFIICAYLVVLIKQTFFPKFKFILRK
jgi:uncharacterized membrane protein YkvI